VVGLFEHDKEPSSNSIKSPKFLDSMSVISLSRNSVLFIYLCLLHFNFGYYESGLEYMNKVADLRFW
jgi:hypothetical protein